MSQFLSQTVGPLSPSNGASMFASNPSSPSLLKPGDFTNNVQTSAGALTGMGGLFKAGAQIIQGFQEKTQYSNEAVLMDQSAQLAMYNAGLRVMVAGNEASRTLGTEAAAAGAGGITAGGSPGLVAAQTVNNAEAASTAARFQGKVQAASDIYQGEIDRWMGNQAAIGGMIGGGMSLLTSAAQVAAL